MISKNIQKFTPSIELSLQSDCMYDHGIQWQFDLNKKYKKLFERSDMIEPSMHAVIVYSNLELKHPTSDFKSRKVFCF